MRFLEGNSDGDFSLTKDFVGDDIPEYAILSHTWGADTEEVTYRDLMDGTGKNKIGYEKIRFCGEQARRDRLEYFWVDTCCIDKENYAELQYALNSMFCWYRNASRCYVYLSDVHSPPLGTNAAFNLQSWDSEFWKSRWFTRGWTLQELLAPRSVEFFSSKCVRLGDKNELKHAIQGITGIPTSALQGAPLSQFSVDERFLWMERRQTKLERDRVYSLLGILDVKIPFFEDTEAATAFGRLREVIDKREKCVQDLRLTDPRHDKQRIEYTKGGLLEDSYRWILENSDFQRWRGDQESRLLWIKGDPGKGKTMLLCGIINELEKSLSKIGILSYFFCQATDSRINHATAVLRGLLYLLLNQQPSLVSHVQKEHDHAGKALFEGTNAWTALCEIFANILQDPNLNNTYLIIDALDECEADLPQLLNLIIRTASISPRVKWIVSSRNQPDIESRLRLDNVQLSLSLELNKEHISHAIEMFINLKVPKLPLITHNSVLQEIVRGQIYAKANGTFL
jgi:nucleoside-triphosphatase THEP1